MDLLAWSRSRGELEHKGTEQRASVHVMQGSRGRRRVPPDPVPRVAAAWFLPGLPLEKGDFGVEGVGDAGEAPREFPAMSC